MRRDCGRSLSRDSGDLSPPSQYQHDTYGGRCGICGDPFGDPKPRAHEIGGPYYKGILVRNYTAGQVTTQQSHILGEMSELYTLRIRDDPWGS